MKRKKIVISVTLALGLVNHSALAQFVANLELSDLNGQNGFTINGVAAGDKSGRSVSSAGDINGDGIDDLIIGAANAEPGGNNDAGSNYVVFGSDSGFASFFDLSDINDLNGLVLNGVATFDSSGFSVSSAGDFNGDGIDDLIIGAYGANNNAGSSYVVFGSNNGFANPFDLGNINGNNGFTINGVVFNDRSGVSVSSAGDINGDGIDDLIIGASGADPGGNSYAGSSYVVFGSQVSLPNPFNLGSLNGNNGFIINGVAELDQSGFAVSSAGDVNGDGIDDLLIGARDGDSGNGDDAGSSYVVFGSVSQFVSPFELSSINGTNGFTLYGAAAADHAGYAVSSAGDVNGDGIDDIIIGARFADPGGLNDAGSSYVVFGSDSSLSHPFELGSINGTNGFTINGASAGDNLGRSVSSAGDVNGDGIGDLIIGAYGANNKAGFSYVIFGSDSGLSNPFNLGSLNGHNGFTLRGVDFFDLSGFSVSSAGDANGDGVDDIIVGAFDADPGGNTSAGSSYVVFGNDFIFQDGFE